MNNKETHSKNLPLHPWLQAAGFTLIETSIVIIITGLMMVPLLNLYHNYKLQKERVVTQDAINYSASVISQFPSANGRYPCPSDRSILPGNPNYGVEMYAGIPACDLTVVPPQGICRTAGARDTDSIHDADAAPDPVIIGGIPTTTLGITGFNMGTSYVLDGWGQQLTYAVSDRLCTPAKSSTSGDYRLGVIAAVDEFGQPTAGIGMADMDIPVNGVNDANGQFVVFSHGPSGNGAFSYGGGQVAPCDVATTDGENCDNDFMFVSALANSNAAGANFYDDMIYFHLFQSNELWTNIPTNTGVATPHIFNRNSGNIGVLTDAPQDKLHVNGDIKADTVRADTLCKTDGSDCLPIDFFGSWKPAGANQNVCPYGEVVTKVYGNKVYCGKPVIQAPIVEQRCPAGKYLRGIKSNGDILCTL